MGGANVKITIEEAKSSDFLLNEFIQENSPLVTSVIKRRFPHILGTEYFEDYLQIGITGMFKSIKNFDASFGVKFSTYAVPMIEGEIKRHARDGKIQNTSSLYVNRPMRLLINKYIYLSSRSKSDEEIIKELEIDEATLREIKMLNMPVTHFDQVIHSGDSTPITLGDKISSNYNLEDTCINNISLKERFTLLKEFVTPKQFQALILSLEGKTQIEIGAILKISQVQVSRIIMKITKKICPAINKFHEGLISRDDMVRIIRGNKYEEVIEEVEKEVAIDKNANVRVNKSHVQSIYDYAINNLNQSINIKQIWIDNNLPMASPISAAKYQTVKKLKENGYNVLTDDKTWWANINENAKLKDNKKTDLIDNTLQRVTEKIIDKVALEPTSNKKLNKENDMFKFSLEKIISEIDNNNNDKGELLELIKTSQNLALLLNKKLKISINIELI
jgi:RNA polymerase sporulation-specific sigma factor